MRLPINCTFFLILNLKFISNHIYRYVILESYNVGKGDVF